MFTLQSLFILLLPFGSLVAVLSNMCNYKDSIEIKLQIKIHLHVFNEYPQSRYAMKYMYLCLTDHLNKSLHYVNYEIHFANVVDEEWLHLSQLVNALRKLAHAFIQRFFSHVKIENFIRKISIFLIFLLKTYIVGS